MRVIRIVKGKGWFEVLINDTFTGENIIIDNNNISEIPLSKKQYMELDTVQAIINNDKPLYLCSQS